MEQLRGGHGLLSHATLPYYGEEDATSEGTEGEHKCAEFICKWRDAYLTGTDVAGLIRGLKPLAIAIDAMVIGAAFTHCTTGP